MAKTYTSIPKGYGECPKCNGTGRMPIEEHQRKYANVMSGYRSEDDSLRCDNCGGQTMGLTAYGYVKHNKQGKPCLHNYVGRNAGRCLTEYTCTECGSRYEIDSGD
jgi:hypothetical protein